MNQGKQAINKRKIPAEMEETAAPSQKKDVNLKKKGSQRERSVSITGFQQAS